VLIVDGLLLGTFFSAKELQGLCDKEITRKEGEKLYNTSVPFYDQFAL